MLVFLVIVVLWFVIKLWLILTEDSGYTPGPYRPVYTKSGEFVYIISWDNNRNLKKIGRTTNPTSRMRTFETASPYKLYIHRILEVPNAVAAERQLHRHFAGYRVRGEWFNITDSQLNEINVVGSGDKFDPQTGRRLTTMNYGTQARRPHTSYKGERLMDLLEERPSRNIYRDLDTTRSGAKRLNPPVRSHHNRHMWNATVPEPVEPEVECIWQ